jgi:predicted ATPase
MAQLDEISIKGYKSIQSLQNFKLTPLNILIGPNGAGKSNFIGLYDFLYQIITGNLQLTVAKSGGADSFLHFGQKHTSKIELHFWFGQNGYSLNLVPAKDALIIEDEIVFFHDKQRFPNPYSNGVGHALQESALKKVSEESNKIAKYVMKSIYSWRVYHFHDTSTSAKVKQQCDLNDNTYLRPDASNLSAFLFLLQETQKKNYNNIIDAIRMVTPFFDDFILRPSPFNEGKIKLEWKEKGSDVYFDAHSFSDGTLRFICLATLLLQPELPEAILIDEPELGLHPYAINVLAELLKSASKKAQVIVSTQSVTLVNQFNPEDVIIVDRENSASIFKRPSAEEITSWMDEYGLGDLWEKNILGGRPS